MFYNKVVYNAKKVGKQVFLSICNQVSFVKFIISVWGHYDDKFKITYIVYPSKRLHSSGVLVHPLAVRRSPTDEFFVVFRTWPVVRFCWVILLCTRCAVFVCVHVCGIGSISPRPLCDFALGRVFDRTARGNRASPVFSSCPTGLCFENQSIRKINRYMLVITNKYTIL